MLHPDNVAVHGGISPAAGDTGFNFTKPASLVVAAEHPALGSTWSICLEFETTLIAGPGAVVVKGNSVGDIFYSIVVDSLSATITVNVMRSILGQGVRPARVTFGAVQTAGIRNNLRVVYADGRITLDANGDIRTATLTLPGSPNELVDCGLGTANCILAVGGLPSQDTLQSPPFEGTVFCAKVVYGLAVESCPCGL